MPSCTGLLEPRKSRLEPLKSTLSAEKFAREMCLAAQNRQKIHKTPILTFKVMEFGDNRELVYDFLLVINSNLGPISHRY